MAAGDILKIEITPGTIFRVVLILIGGWFLYLIGDLLIMLFAAVVVASAIRPVADFLQPYRVPRAVAVLLVYGVALLVVAGVVTLMIPPLTEQTAQLLAALPQVLERLGGLPAGAAFSGGELIRHAEEVLLRSGDSLTNFGANVFRRTQTFFSGLFTVLFVFVIALYLVIDREALKRPFRLVIPTAHLPYTERVIDRAQQKIGRWVVAQLSLGVIIAVVVTVGLWLMGIKYPLVLGLLAGVFELLPVLGPVLAAVPAVAVGFSQSWLLGIIVLGFYLLVQQAENNVLVPVVMRRVTGLNPLLTILAVLLGARLAGMVGVILAVPAAVVLSAFFSDLVAADQVEDLAG